MKYCYKHNREYNDICRFCEEEFQPPCTEAKNANHLIVERKENNNNENQRNKS